MKQLASPFLLLEGKDLQVLPRLLSCLQQEHIRLVDIQELLYTATSDKAALLLLDADPIEVLTRAPWLQSMRVYVLRRSLPKQAQWKTWRAYPCLRLLSMAHSARPTPICFAERSVPADWSEKGIRLALYRTKDGLTLPPMLQSRAVFPVTEESLSKLLQEETHAERLTLGTQTDFFSDPVSDCDLCLLTTDPAQGAAYLAWVDWKAQLKTKPLRYTLHPSKRGLLIRRLSREQMTVDTITQALKDKRYVRLELSRLQLPGVVQGEDTCLLLYGYGENGVYARAFLPRGRMKEVWLPDRALETLLALPCCKASTVKRLKSRYSCDGAKLCEQLLSDFRDDLQVGAVYTGMQAANRFVNRLASGEATDLRSLCFFLQEQYALERKLRFYREQEGLYLEQLDRLHEWLCTEGALLRKELQDTTSAHAISREALCDRLRRLLNLTEACKKAFCEEYKALAALRAFQKEGRTR